MSAAKRTLASLALAGVAAGTAAAQRHPERNAAAERPAVSQRPVSKCDIEVSEATIPMLQAALADGRATSVGLVDAYLARIAAYDRGATRLNAMVRINPHARGDAAAMDVERKAGKIRGPLHGIPVVVKDNYDVAGMPTSAGSIALATLMPSRDATQVRLLRDAGAIILGKTNMHELASGIITISSFGSQTLNPYDPRRIPGGSSGGTGAAIAASFGAIGWGSDTCGSIRIPSAWNNLFGLRPTKGLSSTAGILPLAHSQDVGGPLARTVIDLAIGLDATIGPDPADAATHTLDGRPRPAFQAGLDSGSLRGARLGVVRRRPGASPTIDPVVDTVIRGALAQLKTRGATLVDVDLPVADSAVFRADVTNFEFKFDLMDYLASVPNAPVHSLAEILSLGLYHRALAPALRRRDSVQTRDSDGYRSALAQRVVVRDALVNLLDEHRLDALVYPTIESEPPLVGEAPSGGASCLLSAVSGLPAMAVPAGFTTRALPVGIELLGRPLDDVRLVSFAYSYEAGIKPRRAPATTPALDRGHAPGPLRFTAVAGGAVARASFVFDPTRNTLRYRVVTSGLPSSDLQGVALRRAAVPGPSMVLERLAGPGVVRDSAELVLPPDEAADLIAGRMELVVFTSHDPLGAIHGMVKPRV